MEQLSKITQQGTASAEELAATAEKMSRQAQTLQELMGYFVAVKGSVNVFDLASARTGSTKRTTA